MKAVFMGTPEFAVPSLLAMLEAGIEVMAVVTQPDKIRGRGRSVSFSPVKEAAAERGIPVLQPVRIRKDDACKEALREMSPDVIVVVAFGQIIPKDVLDIPRLGCINVHGSLLPKYRGAAPVQWALLCGEQVTGVTTMLMDEGLDTGDMLLKAETPISDQDTSGTLSDRLSHMGADLLVDTLKGLEAGSITPVKQDDSQTGIYAKMLTKEMGEIDFSKSAKEISLLIRGLDPWPGTFTFIDGKQLRIFEAAALPPQEGTDPHPAADIIPGTITKVGKQDFEVMTGDGILSIRQVQLAGKKRMDAGSFLRGYRLTVGTILQATDK